VQPLHQLLAGRRHQVDQPFLEGDGLLDPGRHAVPEGGLAAVDLGQVEGLVAAVAAGEDRVVRVGGVDLEIEEPVDPGEPHVGGLTVVEGPARCEDPLPGSAAVGAAEDLLPLRAMKRADDQGPGVLRVDGDGRVPEAAAGEASQTAEEKNKACGRLIYQDYQASEAQYPGCIFAISITEDGLVDYFTHRPQQRWWNMDHEELSPMYFQATVRGRLEEDDEKRPLLTLKEPQDAGEYFEFKGMPEPERSGERFVGMIHDEYIRVARKLIETGLSPDTGVELSGLQRFFPGRDDLVTAKVIPLRRLAAEPLSNEAGD